MNSTISNATAPPLPSRVLAEKAAASPEEICAEVGTFGYVGKFGLSVNATAESPKVVAKPNGIAHQARPANHVSTGVQDLISAYYGPPSKYARTAVFGRDAIPLCQYA